MCQVKQLSVSVCKQQERRQCQHRYLVSMLAVSCYYYELCTPQEMELIHFYGLIVENLMVSAYLSKRRGCRVAFVLSDVQHYCWSIIDAH